MLQSLLVERRQIETRAGVVKKLRQPDLRAAFPALVHIFQCTTHQFLMLHYGCHNVSPRFLPGSPVMPFNIRPWRKRVYDSLFLLK